MKQKNIVITITASLLIGVIFFLIHRKVLVIQLNVSSSDALAYASSFDNAAHKPARLYYKKNNAWAYEAITLVWHQNNDTHNLKQLINQWLMTLVDEHQIPSNITLESIALATPGSDLYLSFDRTFFDKDASIMNKWHVIESLLKTIRFANNSIQTITLQVHHHPMPDDHLELTQAIPVQEFCS